MLSLCDLPLEVLTTLVLPELSPFDLARLCQVNGWMNNAVFDFLTNIKSVKMPKQYDDDWRELFTNNEMRRCFQFMTRHTTKLVTLGNDIWYGDEHYRWMLNGDLMRVIQRNPKLRIIDLHETKISHAVLRQLLLCKNLKFVR